MGCFFAEQIFRSSINCPPHPRSSHRGRVGRVSTSPPPRKTLPDPPLRPPVPCTSLGAGQKRVFHKTPLPPRIKAPCWAHSPAAPPPKTLTRKSTTLWTAIEARTIVGRDDWCSTKPVFRKTPLAGKEAWVSNDCNSAIAVSDDAIKSWCRARTSVLPIPIFHGRQGEGEPRSQESEPP